MNDNPYNLSAKMIIKLHNIAQRHSISEEQLLGFIKNFKSTITSNMNASALNSDEQALAIFKLYFDK